MNPHVKRFFLIFCIIGFAACLILAVANASAKPASTSGATMFAVIGVVLAASVLVLLPEIGRQLAEYRMLIFGAAMVGIMVWRPGGLLSGREPTIRLHKKGGGGGSAPVPAEARGAA